MRSTPGSSVNTVQMGKVDLRLSARRCLEAHFEPWDHTWPDAAENVFDRGVAASIAEVA